MEKKESIIQWASRRQTSMATSAPEAEVSAMAEGFAVSIFLFDTLSEIGLVSGTGPSAIMSMKTDSAVALKQLGTQSVTVRTWTAAQKLNYLRELIYDDPQVEPIYISGDSQRADGLTKILSGRALMGCQESLNLACSTFPTDESQDEEKSRQQIKKKDQVATAQVQMTKIGACVVNRQSGTESGSLDSIQVGSRDISVVPAPVCIACQEGQVQEVRSRNTLIMICCCSHLVQEAKACGHRRKGRLGGEAPESQAQSASGSVHGSGQSLQQEIAQARMKALQHTEVPSSSSTSSSSKGTKAQGKTQSRPQKDVVPPVLETPNDMATDQSIEQSDMSLPCQETTQLRTATSWADITAQDEDVEQSSINLS